MLMEDMKEFEKELMVEDSENILNTYKPTKNITDNVSIDINTFLFITSPKKSCHCNNPLNYCCTLSATLFNLPSSIVLASALNSASV